MILFCRIVPESPRWLMNKNKPDKAYEVYKRIAKSNKKSIECLDSLKDAAEKQTAISNVVYTESENSSVDSGSINKIPEEKQVIKLY
jgi:hypothetical protein